MPMPKPQTDNKYLKAPKAEQSIVVRILGDPIEFYEVWKAKKPTRRPAEGRGRDFPDGSYDPTELDKFGHANKPKYVQAFAVMHDHVVKVLALHQTTILNGLFFYENNAKWGDLTTYDITIIGDADGKGYTVAPDPKTPMDQGDADEWMAVKIAGFDLRALIDNKDPFNPGAPEEQGDDSIPF